MDGRYVAGISRIGALRRMSEVIRHCEGGDTPSMRLSPGATGFEPITIERGVTHDLDFERWPTKVWNHGGGGGAEVSLKDFRKDLLLELANEAGQVVLAYRIHRCRPSDFQSVPDLDPNSHAVAIQRQVLQNEGWERDRAVTEPAEPTCNEPDPGNG